LSYDHGLWDFKPNLCLHRWQVAKITLSFLISNNTAIVSLDMIRKNWKYSIQEHLNEMTSVSSSLIKILSYIDHLGMQQR
jgi:hypothetical protein